MGAGEEGSLLFFVNGKKVEDAKVDPEETLLYYLRNSLNLCGTKLGCGEGGCGACTVMVSHYKDGKVIHRAVNACLAPVMSVHLCAVTTIEGIGSTKTKLHKVQKVLVENHGSQCGFCTPGIVMSMYTLLRNNPVPTEHMIERALQGNLCRCTGYRPILQGFKMFTAEGNVHDEINNDIGSGVCALGDDCCKNKKNEETSTVPDVAQKSAYTPDDASQEPIFPPELKSANFRAPLILSGPRATWFRPNSLIDFLKLRMDHPESKVITGNTECGVETKFGGRFYPKLISPVAVPELNEITINESRIIAGASATLNEIDAELRAFRNENPSAKNQVADAIIEILRWFAGDQIRNVSAIGGNLMTASPISDLTPILMAAGATAKFAKFNNSDVPETNCVPIDASFFTGYRKTVMPETSALLEVSIPHNSENGFFRAYKQSKRKEDDIAIVNAAFLVDFEPESLVIKTFRASYGGVGPTTRLAKSADKFIGAEWNEKLLAEMSEALEKEFDLPANCPGGFVAYRKCLVTSFFFKFFLTVQQELSKKGLCDPNENSDVSDLDREPFESIQCADVQTTDAVGQSKKIISGGKQCTGEAVYLDDMPKLDGELYFGPVLSQRAHAKIKSVDFSAAEAVEGVAGHVWWKDVKGDNRINDEEYFRQEVVTSCGQIVAGILAVDEKIARRAAKLVKIEYEDISPVIVTIEDAIKHESYLPNAPRLRHNRGDPDKAFEEAEHKIESTVRMGGQEHFYFETQASYCIPIDNSDEFHIHSSCQNVAEGQHSAAHALGVPMNHIKFAVKRLGGGFGGKESRFQILSSAVAVAAQKFNRPVRCMLDRDEDMMYSGGRHAFLSNYKVGFDSSGKISSVSIMGYQNAGCSTDLSVGVLSRYIDHSINCYHFPNFRVVGHCMMTNTPSNTAFRGFGGPQGMLVAEDIISKVADYLKMPVEEVRQINFLKPGDRLPFGEDDKQILTDEHIIKDLYEKTDSSWNMAKRRAANDEFNKANKYKKRGVALVPTQFGIAFGLKFLNQGGALVQIYTDGSVLVAHGGVEMGQGLYTKMIQIASKELDIPVEKIHTLETSSTTVPNTSPTAASYSSDINGWAVKKACEELRERLSSIHETDPFITWEEKIKKAYFQRISLSATAFWKAPDVTWDPVARIGKRYNYYCYGACGADVEVDLLTGHHTIRDAEIMMDVGRSLNPAVDIGQVEGAFMQGVGLMTIEEELYSPTGRLLTRGPGAYKIPGFGDIPAKLKVSLYDKFSNRHGLYHSKGVGEPPLFMGAGVFYALRDAIRQVNTDKLLDWHSPATVERIRLSVGDALSTSAKSTTPATDAPWCVRR
ncbi:Oidioi.mRNA.OKI2018_I69.chr2.g8039.t1.cds [Oikopleura dioica]|uniref:Xanthine dehydrogenase/oxidase n=1 Tax=Oikopleura dioica TaxID=34765 RepID=A0ABN7TCQ0_OIKDI|nr:Oidioi.mRNA.OKI2018_I69.chr2.g8039.t1.cds [Oikopleura dioica]